MFMNDTEVWRTSTAEPVKSPGIRWTVLKDMSHFLPLWKSPQKLIFDLGNLIDDEYTGTFNATLTASFYHSGLPGRRDAAPADLILPISANRGAQGLPSHFDLPRDKATRSLILPRNINRAIATISANGQAAEEFWWSNVLETDKTTFSRTSGVLPGLSPFREVQLLIDDRLAGVSWPFPVIFTGGVTPSLHRPIVNPQAFDLREHQVDITPWLPLLCDGHEHTFTLRVVGIQDDGRQGGTLSDDIGASWYVTGKIFAWLDEDSTSITTGTISPDLGSAHPLHEPTISLSRAVSTNETGFTERLSFELTVQRELEIHATVRSQRSHSHVQWTQRLEYANVALVDDYGFTQVNDFRTRGSDVSQGPDHDRHFEVAYEYPLNCNQSVTYGDAGDMTIRSTLIEGFHLKSRGRGVLPIGTEGYYNITPGGGGGAVLHTHRQGSGQFFAPAPSAPGEEQQPSLGFGSTQQLFYFGKLAPRRQQPLTRVDEGRELYFRNVTATNGSIVDDLERCAAAPAPCSRGGGGGWPGHHHAQTQQAFDNGRDSGGGDGGGGGTQAMPLLWSDYAEPRNGRQNSVSGAGRGSIIGDHEPTVFGAHTHTHV